MLVLRRRSQEVIVFEGGLSVTVLDVTDHRAWLGFEAPSIPSVVAISSQVLDTERAQIGVRSPSSLVTTGRRTTVALTPGPPDPNAVLQLTRHVGDEIACEGITFTVASIANARVSLSLEVACIGRPVAVSVHSISGLEARIGIDAPDDLRVYRKELWLELLDANRGAAGWSEDNLGALIPPPER